MDTRARIALQWSVTLRQPLISTVRRAALDEAMAKLCFEDEPWAMWWLGGQIADHVLTLPAEDPWRNLSARTGELVRGPAPPDRSGVVGKYGAFGTTTDGTDLVAPVGGVDADLVTLSSGLMPSAAILLAFAADGHQQVAQAWLACPTDSYVGLFAAFSDALMWSMWRRRTYVGLDDELDEISATGWLWRAEVLAGGGELDAKELVRLAAEREAVGVPDGHYDMYAHP